MQSRWTGFEPANAVTQSPAHHQMCIPFSTTGNVRLDCISLAESVRFELTVPFGTLPFQDSLIGHSSTTPILICYELLMTIASEDLYQDDHCPESLDFAALHLV